MIMQLKVPVLLLILDFIGTMLLGLGLVEKFAGTGFVPRTMQFPNYEWILIIMGALLIAPFIGYLVKSIINANNL